MFDKRVRRNFSLLACFMLFACTIYKDVSYFDPVPRQDIRVVAGWSGLKNIVKFRLSETIELSLIISAQPEHSAIRLFFFLPAGEVVRFENANLIVTPSGGGKRIVATIETIQANYVVNGRGSFIYLTSGEDLEGANYTYKTAFGGSATMLRSFQIDVEVPAPFPDQFRLRVPDIKLSGKTISFPEVEFRRKIGSAYQGSPP